MPTPNFFLIGAPKCGTTSMADWLSQNRQVFVSTPKEPAYFSTDVDQSRYGSLAAYEALFDAANDEHRAIGEASTHYLWSAVAVPRILEYNPEARFIVMLRSPLAMARSVHAHNLRNAREDLADFAAAWRAQDERRRGTRIPRGCPSPNVLQYGEICRLGAQVERLFSFVERDQVHVVLLEDMQADPARSYSEVAAFLGVEPTPLPSFTPRNVRSEARFTFLMRWSNYLTKARIGLGLRPTGLMTTGAIAWIKRLNMTPSRRPPPLGDAIRSELTSYFSEDVQRLGRAIGRDLSHWFND